MQHNEAFVAEPEKVYYPELQETLLPVSLALDTRLPMTCDAQSEKREDVHFHSESEGTRLFEKFFMAHFSTRLTHDLKNLSTYTDTDAKTHLSIRTFMMKENLTYL